MKHTSDRRNSAAIEAKSTHDVANIEVRARCRGLVFAVAGLLMGGLCAAEPDEPARVGCHFNDDEFSDLTIGVPGEAVGSISGAGAVNIIYGADGGLSAADNQIWSQETLGSTPEVGDAFGAAIVCGDFNGDELDDLAIGVPHESVAN